MQRVNMNNNEQSSKAVMADRSFRLNREWWWPAETINSFLREGERWMIPIVKKKMKNGQKMVIGPTNEMISKLKDVA